MKLPLFTGSFRPTHYRPIRGAPPRLFPETAGVETETPTPESLQNGLKPPRSGSPGRFRALRGTFFLSLSSPSAKSSELLGQAGLLQNRISCMTRLDSIVDRKPRIGQGRVPDFMVALTLTLLAATCLMQDAL